MRNAFRFLTFMFSLFIVHTQASAALDVSCSSTWALDAVANPYGNAYHAGIPDNAASSAVSSCFWSLSYAGFLDRQAGSGSLMQSGGRDYKVHRVFPVYSRVSGKPFLVQSVTFIDGKYSSMSSTPTRLYEHLWAKDDCKQTRLPDAWINPSPCPQKPPYATEDRKNLILLADTEPYATAPTIQFYSYHNKLLMVARNEKGEVYRFAYEDSVHRISSKTVKEFLGYKWFRP